MGGSGEIADPQTMAAVNSVRVFPSLVISTSSRVENRLGD
jgi:hypothetical protein